MTRLHPEQKKIASSNARYKVIRAGRRSGKSTVEIEIMLFKAVMKDNQHVFYIAPTQRQARSIIWENLKNRIGNIGEANESRLEMKVPTQDGGKSTIFVAGWENRENFRGMKANHITFDEVDTCKDFFIGWQEIFRPALIDTLGTADFIGTPKKENPNLRRLEKELERLGEDYEPFHFTTADNIHIPNVERELEKAKMEMDKDTYRQEILAEYVEDLGALFRYTALTDMFTNTVDKTGSKYMTVDVAEDGSDKTIFAMWEDLECYRMEVYERLNTDAIINKIREYAAQERIPYSQIAVDAIGVGSGVATSAFLDGIISFKSSHAAIKTDQDPVKLPNMFAPSSCCTRFSARRSTSVRHAFFVFLLRNRASSLPPNSKSSKKPSGQFGSRFKNSSPRYTPKKNKTPAISEVPERCTPVMIIGLLLLLSNLPDS